MATDFHQKKLECSRHNILLRTVQMAGSKMDEKNENLSFREAEHPQHLVRELNLLRKSEEFCDVKILVGSRSFPAHRCILSSACSYFRLMFSSGLKESHKSEVEIFGISETIFDIILEFIYTGNVIVEMDDTQDLLVAANMLQIVSLKEACSSHLQNRIDCTNCIGLFEFAGVYDCQELKRLAKLFIVENFVKVFQKENEEFLELECDKLSEFLSEEDLKVESEEEILKIALQWLLHDAESRIKQASVILGKIRLPLLPLEIISNVIQNARMENEQGEEELKDYSAKVEQMCKNIKKLQLTVKYNISVRRGTMKFIYIVGGYRSPQGFSWLSGDCLSTTEKFDFESGRSKCSLPQMHEAKRSHAVAAIGGSIYVFGGECESLLSNMVEKYDPHLSKWVVAGYMNTPRCGFGVAVVEDTVFFVGGCTGSKLTKDIDRYDIKTNKMVKVGELSVEKAYFGCAVCEGNIYVSGGIDKYDDYLATTEMLDPFPYRCKTTYLNTTKDDGDERNNADNDPFQLATKDIARMATARANHCLVTMNDYMFSIGGQSNPKYTLRLIDRYDPKSDVWETFTLLPDPRSHVAAVSHLGKVYVIGGRDQNGNTLKSLIFFIPETDKIVKWSKCTKLNIELDRCDMSALVL